MKAQRDQLLASRRRVDAKAQKSHEVARSLFGKLELISIDFERL